MIGCNTDAFYFSPSIFGLRINNLYFLNGSDTSLISKQLGLPYPINKTIYGKGFLADIHPGKGKLRLPIFEIEKSDIRTELYQPINSFDLTKFKGKKLVQQYFNTNQAKGIIHIKSDKMREYPIIPSSYWTPNIGKEDEVYDTVSASTAKLHSYKFKQRSQL